MAEKHLIALISGAGKTAEEITDQASAAYDKFMEQYTANLATAEAEAKKPTAPDA